MKPARPRRDVAALVAPSRAEGSGALLTTGEFRITGTDRFDRTERSARSGHPGPAAFLEAKEIAAEVQPFGPEIERCYLERLGDVRRAGHLDLTFVIGRDGSVVSLAAAAPGLPAKTAGKVLSCIREAVDTLHFPERRNDTTAIVPYYFQHTTVPDAGPRLGCRTPRGC